LAITSAHGGLIDIKDGAVYVTVSWNHQHDSWKMSLTTGGCLRPRTATSGSGWP
jgi:pectate lyase